jgi:hypothetical protein
VEARVALELEEGRWNVERTGELRPVATAGAAGRIGATPGRMRGRRRAWGVGKLYFLVELSTALAPLVLHVAHHAKQHPHVPIQEFVVVLDHLFQVLHMLPHRLHCLETFINRCVEL